MSTKLNESISSLERNALSQIKGGKAAGRTLCPSHGSCSSGGIWQGSAANAIREGDALEKNRPDAVR